MIQFNIKNGSIAGGVGLVGLAIYQFTTGDYASGLQSLFSALAAFGVSVGLNRSEELKQQAHTLRSELNRKGML